MEFSPHCPLPSPSAARITLAHGEGGRLSRELLSRIFAWLDCPELQHGADAALLVTDHRPLAFTCDGYVVTPLFFPGGDIGSLAVNGTINDLAVAGARPLALSLALVLEEGLPVETLESVIRSVAQTARQAHVRVVTGDTKVVPRGACDGMFLNTSGVGHSILEIPGPAQLSVDDVLIVSGPVGRHGIAVMAARESLDFDPMPESDCGCLWPAVESLITAGVAVKAMRDATRGGVAAVLHEWAAASGASLVIDMEKIPESPPCRGVAELMGLDRLHVACEGTMVVAVSESEAESALSALRRSEISQQAAVFGRVEPRRAAAVCRRELLGTLVAIDEPAGAPLPRIC